MFEKLKKINPIFVLFIGLFLTKGISFLQNLVIAYLYGTSSISDSLVVSLTLPNMIYAVLSTAVTQCYVPIYKKHYQDDKYDNNKYTTLLFGCMFILGAILSLIIYISIPLILKVMLPYSDISIIETTTIFMKFLSVVSIFVFWIGILQGFFQSIQSYFMVSIISVPLNICLILSLLIGKGNVEIIGGLMVLSYILQFMFFFFCGYKKGFRISFGKIDTYYLQIIKSTLIMVLPLFVGGIINDFSSIIDKSFASMFDVGVISGMDYGYKVSGIIYSLISLPIMTIFYPNLSELLANDNMIEGFNYFKDTVFYTLCITIPLIIIVIIFGKEICTILFLRGNFSINSLEITSQSLTLYCISIVPMLIRNFFEKIFYATTNTKVSMINTIITLIVNIIGNIIFSWLFGFQGLILSTVISFMCSCIFFYIMQKRMFSFKFLKDELFKYLKLIIVIIICCIIFIMLRMLLGSTIPNVKLYYFVEILLSSIMYISIYLLLLRLFRVINFSKLIGFFKNFK